MSKNLLIDSAHAEEVRVAVVDGEKLDKFDFEVQSKAQVKGNIYLAKIVRVEPSLQAAFVDYGVERHGFLSFSEIHHDYFQIPVGDREDLESHIQNAISSLLAETGESIDDLDPQKIARLRYQFYRRYKIQEVIKKRQVILVQVTKEERGNKGAALTTYVSLTGRYCVYMPNMSKGSGVSRKVVGSERAKVKKIIASLSTESGSVVIRTAGGGRTKTEITKDFNYLKKMWDEIRETTVKSIAPCLIHEEAGIVKRAIRDWYSRDMENIFVEGKDGYQVAKAFMKKLMPTRANKVKLYEDQKLPLFGKFKINDQINQIYSTRANLPSGGYLVINSTEALVSIDVNSGRSIRERNVGEMALKTNLEAAAEIARQCRLRDLGGLIVVDFIDMADKRANSQVEKRLGEALREDKAKIQVGTISRFGLLEFSRQRLRASITDANTIICPCCGGIGVVWSDESVAIKILREAEEALALQGSSEAVIVLSSNAALYLMNKKRAFISSIEERTNSKITFRIDDSLPVSEFRIEQTPQACPPQEKEEESKQSPAVAKFKGKKAAPPAENVEKKESSDEVADEKDAKAVSVASEQKGKGEFQKRNARSNRKIRGGNIKNAETQKDKNAESPTEENNAAAVHLPDEEEIMSIQENLALNMTKLARSYKEQEMTFVNS
ncbi:MAG: Rne/Rng family ribonuclease, partial [Holosporaceae bacterium]|nr:Rne/Rng family ribonuclease [Holosporaceae bacterium]